MKFTNYTIRGHDIERIVAISYDSQDRPFAAYTITEEEHMSGGRCYPPEVRKQTIIAYSEWSFEWSKREHAYLYYSPGGGGGWPDLLNRQESQLWINREGFEGFTVGPQWSRAHQTETMTRVKKLLARAAQTARKGIWQDKFTGTIYLPEPIDLGKGHTNPFINTAEYTAEQGKAIYCRKCDDWLRDDSDNPCQHIRWCDEHSQHTGPGIDKAERCCQRKRHA